MSYRGPTPLVLLLAAIATAAPLRIMPLGNSITEGSDGSPTYRYFLWQNLQALGVDADFVGSKHGVKDNGRPLHPDFDQDHEGHWGWRADSILLYIGAWARQTQPDVVLMHLGTNDWFQDEKAGIGAYVKNTLADYGAIVDSLRSANPRVTVIVGQLIPAYYGAPIDSLNARIPAFAKRKSTPVSRVIAADIHASVRMAADGDFGDGLHPNAEGQRKMADAWTRALVNYLGVAAPPRLSPSAGAFVDSVSVAVTSFTDGAVIRYTLDGTDPTDRSPAYAAPLHFQGDTAMTVSARAYARGKFSPVSRAAISVAYDTTTPSVAYLAASQQGRIRVGFSEPCNAAALRLPGTFSLSGGVRLDSVVVSTDGSSVTLHTSPLKPASSYRLSVRGLVDRSLRENALAATKTLNLSPSPGGKVVAGIWTKVAGESVAALTKSPRFTQPPDRIDTLLSLASAPANLDQYGSRIRCLITAPATGDYAFWIAGDDAAELWLSTGPDSTGRKLIASVPHWTAPLQWEKFPEQASPPVRLVKGQRYWCEVLHKEGIGGDHVAVAWRVPGGVREVVDGVFLQSR